MGWAPPVQDKDYEADAKVFEAFNKRLDEIEEFLEGKEYIAGTSHPTIADVYIY